MQGLVLVFVGISATSSALQLTPPLLNLQLSLKNWCQYMYSDKAEVSELSVSVYRDTTDTRYPHEITQAAISRRHLFRGALWSTGMMYWGSGSASIASEVPIGRTKSLSGRLVDQVEPDEKETYAEAQNVFGPGATTQKRILWVGSGDMRRGVSANLFQAGNEVIAVDLIRPDAKDIHAATRHATEYGYDLRFEQGDATNLKFKDETFDVVVSSMFLCQDFDPEVVVPEIRRVLKPGGRFGFYEHVEDIDKVIIDKVFGEQSVIRVQAHPEQTNVIAGIVKKV